MAAVVTTSWDSSSWSDTTYGPGNILYFSASNGDMSFQEQPQPEPPPSPFKQLHNHEFHKLLDRFQELI